MRLARQAGWVTLLLFVLAGCNPAADFSLVEAAPPTLDGLRSLHGTATVENGGRRELVIENARLEVSYRGRALGAARLMLPVALPAHATTPTRYDLALENFSLTSLQLIMSRAVSNPDAIIISGEVWLRWGFLHKKVKIKNMSLAQLMNIIPNFAPLKTR
jgi:hypothetical protein